MFVSRDTMNPATKKTNVGGASLRPLVGTTSGETMTIAAVVVGMMTGRDHVDQSKVVVESITANEDSFPVPRCDAVSRKHHDTVFVDTTETMRSSDTSVPSLSSSSSSSCDGAGCGSRILHKTSPWRVVRRSWKVLGSYQQRFVIDVIKVWRNPEIDVEITASEYETFLRNMYIGHWNTG